MKYAIGFLIGVVATSIFFTLKLKKLTQSPTSTDSITQISDPEAERLPEDFEDFYIKFHEDSVYQIGHVLFPLRGLPTNADSAIVVNGGFHWQAEDWRMHQPFSTQNGQYMREFTSLGEELITEDIYTKDGFGMQRRFMKTDNEWFLIYYSAMNKMR